MPCSMADWSLPSRERGLKSVPHAVNRFYFMSLPSRERGLKFLGSVKDDRVDSVAPFTGAWIEINLS